MYLLHWLRVLLGVAGQVELQLMIYLEPPSMSYRTVCRWLLLLLGLEVLRRGQAVNQDWMLLLLVLGPSNERYKACCGQMLLVSEILGKFKV